MISIGSVSAVVPCHNSSAFLVETVRTLRSYAKFDIGIEVILVENGSSDNTWQICQDLATDFSEVFAIQSEPGLGNALRAGVQNSTCDFLYITADDLPFGESDFANFLADSRKCDVLVGSKGHRDSEMSSRGWRNLSSAVFSLLQRLITKIPLRDTQGTFFSSRDVAQRIFRETEEEGFLISLEALMLARAKGLSLGEVPVRYLSDSRDGKTTLRVGDVRDMFTGLFRLRTRFQRRTGRGISEGERWQE